MADIFRTESITEQKVRRALHGVSACETPKTNLMSPERPYQKIFIELSFPNTEQLVNDKFDQIYEDKEQCQEYALTEELLQENRLITWM